MELLALSWLDCAQTVTSGHRIHFSQVNAARNQTGAQFDPSGVQFDDGWCMEYEGDWTGREKVRSQDRTEPLALITTSSVRRTQDRSISLLPSTCLSLWSRNLMTSGFTAWISSTTGNEQERAHAFILITLSSFTNRSSHLSFILKKVIWICTGCLRPLEEVLEAGDRFH